MIESTFVDVLAAHAARIGERRAFAMASDGDSEPAEVSYRQLAARACIVAGALKTAGCKEGDPVVLLFPQGLEFVSALFGCFYAGAIAVPATDPYRLNRTQLRLNSICQDSGARLGLTTSSVLARLESLRSQKGTRSVRWLAVDSIDEDDAIDPAPQSPESLALIQYTSGSTSRPKGVALTHRNLLYNQHCIWEAAQQSEQSTFVGWLPPYHDMGLIGLILHPVYIGAQSVLLSTMSFLRHPFRWLQAMSRYRATATAAPNFAFDLCVDRTTEAQRRSLDLSCLEAVVNGAEPVRRETLCRFSEAFAPCGFNRRAFYPSYGLGEATLLVSGRREHGDAAECWVDAREIEFGKVTEAAAGVDGSRVVVSCGRPARGLEVVIVDPRTRKPCAEGNVGEIWVRGGSVGNGYWKNRPQSERVFAAQLNGVGDRRFLRTGDLAFMREGQLFVTGRRSDVIIVRGRNIHPEDLERTAETSHANVLAHACAAFGVEATESEQICLVQEVRPGSDYVDITTALRRNIANEHDVELYSVVLVRPNQIPRTSSGKIRRKACREALAKGKLRELFRSDLNRVGEISSKPFATAGNSLEESIRQILSELLHVPVTNLHSNQEILGLGVDSLQAVELQHALEQRFGVSLDISDLLGARIDEVVAAVERQSAQPTAAPRPETNQAESFALTPGQSALWFEYERNPESSALHLGGAIRVRGKLDERALALAFERLLERHVSLRTRFTVAQSIPWQRVDLRAPVPLGIHDASALSDAELLEELQREFNRPFALKTELPVRLQLYRIAERQAVILFTVHHIVADLISLRVLTSELSELYGAAIKGVAAPPAAASFAYADYVGWYEQLLTGPAANSLATFWKTELANEIPLLELPQAHAPVERTLRRGGLRRRTFSDSLLCDIDALARQENLTRFTILLGAFKILLHRYTQQSAIAVGTPVAVRPHNGSANTVGYFVNMIALHSEVSSADSGRDFLCRLQEKTRRALDHSAHPFSHVAQDRRRAGIRDAVSEMPVVFNYYGAGKSPDLAALAVQPPGFRMSLGNCEVETLPLERLHCQFDLSLTMAESGAALSASVEYNSDLYEQDFVERLLAHLEMILIDLVRDPSQSIADLSLLTVTEHAELIRWNDTAVHYDEIHVLHKLIEQQLNRQPSATAVSCEDRSLTYAELDRKSTDLASYLVARGAGRERPVAVMLPPGLEMLVSLLGILKAAAAYMPVDPAGAPEQVERLLAQAAPALVLSTTEAAGGITTSVPLVCLDQLTLPPGSAAALPEARPEDLAYIMHTSGSTGEPKGVMISHNAICNRLLWMRDRYRPTSADRILQKTPYTFDVSVWELFLPLITGVEMVIARPGGYRDPAYLVDLIRRRNITIVHFVPSMLQLFLEEPGVSQCESLRLVICSGEPLSASLRDRCFAILKAGLHNLYGPTEAAIDVTCWPCERSDSREVIPIGWPISNVSVHILDSCNKQVPVGIAGELHLAGTGLARGYWRRPDLTAAVFRQVALNGDEPVRVYATGDRARYRADGSIEFLGRRDDQVKIHGVRVELGEVEAALRRHPAIGNCVVKAFSSNGDGLRLAAYIPNAPGLPTAGELRSFLSRNLAAAFIPSVYCVVDSLPTTASGKIMRNALPAPSACNTLSRPECDLPEAHAETLLAQIWREVLDVDQIGINENFFELGGDSLRVLQIRNRALLLGYVFSVEDVFQHPTIRELAPLLRAVSDSELQPARAPFSLVRPEVRARLEAYCEDAFPLTKTQEALLFHSQSDENYEIYLLSITIASAFSQERFNEAIATIVGRHPMFRVSYDYLQFDEFLQVVHRELPVRVEVSDLTSHSETEQEEIITRWLRDESQQAFDWSTPPLIRFHVHQRSPNSFQLTVSHAFYDGWSLSSAIVELLREYHARMNNAASPLPPAPAALYRDFVATEQAAINDPACREFWQHKLAGVPPLHVIRRSSRRNSNRDGAVRRNVVIDPRVASGLRKLAKSAHAPLKSVLLALHLRVLSQLSGRRDVLTGLITNGRLEQPDGDRVVGLFLNTVPLRIELGKETWRELVQLTFKAEQELWPFRRYPLAEIRSLLGVTPFDTAFNYINFHIYNQLRGQDLHITGWKNPSDLTYFPLCAYFTEDPIASRLLFYLDHDGTLDNSETERIIRYYEKAFELAASDPEAIAADQELRSQVELAAHCNPKQATEYKAPTRTVLQLFEERAAKAPATIAVAGGGRTLSYAELNASANRLARYLREVGVKNGVPVGIKLDRRPDLAIAILAILKAGGAFVSLDQALPHERIADIAADCGLGSIIVSEPDDAVAALGANEISLTGPYLDHYSPENPNYDVELDQLAYVMYTSGSTGRPKGVEITHRNLVNVLLSVGDHIAISAADKWLAVTSLSFDISVLELLLPLISGARIELADSATARDGVALAELLARSGATIMQATPSMWRLLLEAGWDGSPRLRALCGGEALTPQLAGELLSRCQSLWNMYGPTETTIWSTTARIITSMEQPSIGHALANTALYVLNENGETAPVGVPGELYIGGLGVARGYRNRPRETARQFVPDPFAAAPGARMYCTGDKVVRRSDGALDFLGRLDGQVKIRGHRVEFGEIENTLRSHAAVREVVVTMRRRAEDDVQLIAYVLPAAGANPSPASLKEYVARVLPAYMIPAEIISVTNFQMNANGKIDRNVLPQLPTLEESHLFTDRARSSGAEEVIADIWRELLGRKEVDRHQNVFHLGAHSLLVMRCCVKIKQELNISCGPAEIFRFPTIAGIAAYLDSVKSRPAEDENAERETRNPTLTPAMHALIARRKNVWNAGSAASD